MFEFDWIVLPSSGQMINLNVSKSSGSGKSVLHVFGKHKSVISATEMVHCFSYSEDEFRRQYGNKLPFWILSWAALDFLCVPLFCSPSFFCCLRLNNLIILRCSESIKFSYRIVSCTTNWNKFLSKKDLFPTQAKWWCTDWQWQNKCVALSAPL